MTLLLTELPSVLGYSIKELAQGKNTALSVVKSEIEGVIKSCREAARMGLLEALRVEITDPRDAREVAKDWASSFYSILPASHSTRPAVMRMQMEYDSDDKMIDSVVAVISRVSLPRWEDEDVARFEDNIRRIVQDVEECCLQSDLSSLRGQPAADSIKKLLLQRIASNVCKLGELSNKRQMEKLLKEVLASSHTVANLK